MANQLPQSKSKSNRAFSSDEEAIRVLKLEGRKLEECAKKVWKLYLSSYQPKVYAEHKTGIAGKRTGASLDSIKLGEVKKLDNNEWGIEVTFKDNLAYHESVIRKSEPQGHAIMLISFGWKVTQGSHRDVKHFGYRQGYNYLGKVQKLYNRVKDPRINLEIQWLGNKNYTR